MVLPFKRQIAGGELPADGEGTLSGNNPVQFVPTTAKKAQGRCAMARIDLGYLPKQNPCAQCGKPIAAPDWIENGPRRISYLWRCRACDYRFEAVAFYDNSQSELEALAA
jgi:hypothetical protein